MQCNPKGLIFRVKDTLRTLRGEIKNRAHLNVRILPLLTILFLAIFLPISLNNGLPQASFAEAALGWPWQGLVDGLQVILFAAIKIIALVIFTVTGYTFALSGKIFEASVIYSLSGELYSSFQFINVGWVFIRDLINSLFIFVVLYIAFQQLLKMEGGVDTKKLQSTLVKIIMAALLINFSLFFTKAAIDVSNFLTRAIYYQMVNVPTDGSDPTYGPANALVAGLNMQTLLKDSDVEDASFSEKLGNFKDDQIIKALVYIGGSAVHIIAAVMFYTMAFFFMARILVLIVIMMTSPIYFLSFILGNVSAVKKYKGMWQDQLISQVTFPIAFMLIIYIAVTFVNQKHLTMNSGETMSGALVGDQSGFAVIINFAIVLFIMYLATSTAKSQAGSYVNKLGEAVAGKAAAAGFSTAAWAGRNTFGGLGRRMSESETGKKWAASNNRFVRMAGDSVISGGKAMYEGNWDLRSSGPISDAYGFANANTHNLKVGGPTSRNAKANVPEWWTKNKSKDGQAKEAARITRKVESFNTVEARTSKAREQLGDKINNKEYKSVREKLINDIKTEYKDKPEEQKKLLVKLLGQPAYDSADNKAIRSEIEMAQNKEDYKKKSKEHIAASKELSEAQKAVNSAGTAVTAEMTARLTAAKEKVQGVPANPTTGAAAIKGTSDNFKEISKKVPRDMTAELAVEDITHFKDQLSAAQLASISKKMSDGGYVAGDVDKLNEFIKDLRATTTDRAVREWINTEATKGTGGFNLRLETEVGEKVAMLNTVSKTSPEGIKLMSDITGLARVLSRNETMALDLDSFIQLSKDNLIIPVRINEYAKKVRNSGDAAEVARLDTEASTAEAASLVAGISQSERDRLEKLYKAFRGKLK
jgi:hypothetical protein